MANKVHISKSYDYNGYLKSESRSSNGVTISQSFDTCTSRQKLLDTYSENKRYKTMIRERSLERFNGFGSFLKLLLVFMLVIIFVSYLQGNLRIPTFTSLLEGLDSFDVIPSIPFLNFSNLELGEWVLYIWREFDILGVTIPALTINFNFLRDMFSWLLSSINLLVFIVNGLISIINFCIFFIRWIFVG